MVGYISLFFLTQIQVDLTSHLKNWVTKKQLKYKKTYILFLRDLFPLIDVQQMSYAEIHMRIHITAVALTKGQPKAKGILQNSSFQVHNQGI